MIVFVIKFTLCLTLFLGIYHLFLEREKMHTFNRFYLILSLCLALSVPFIELENASKTTIVTAFIPLGEEITYMDTPPAEVQIRNFFPSSFLFIYGLGILAFSIRFCKNLLTMRATIRRHELVKYKNATLVLLSEKVLPHSFLGYIFLNKESYRQGRIKKELLAHELAHVEQKHSWDILFIEFLGIIFWYLPLIYLYKRAIKLNHEFLADEAVISSYQNISFYQQMLLNMLSTNNSSSLASQINYSLTKKRFAMMTKNTSPFRALVKKAAIAPLFIMIVLILGTKTRAQEPAEAIKKGTQTKRERAQDLDSLLEAKDNFYKHSGGTFGFKYKNGQLIHKKYVDLTALEKQRLPMPPAAPVKKTPTQKLLNEWLDKDKYGVWIDGKRVENSRLKNYKADNFGNYAVSRLARNAKNYGKHVYQLDLMTLETFEDFRKEWIERFKADK